ncbi:MAG: chemotaxis protein CheW [Acidobacteriota bacterium]
MAHQMCTFVLDRLLFAVEVERVQEVIRYQDATPVLTAPDSIAGLINLRGQIVTAIDLRRRIGLREREQDARPMNIVVRAAEGAVSLLVDEIGEVVEVDPESFEPLPETITGSMRTTTSGVYKLEHALLHALDLAATLQISAAPDGHLSKREAD